MYWETKVILTCAGGRLVKQTMKESFFHPSTPLTYHYGLCLPVDARHLSIYLPRCLDQVGGFFSGPAMLASTSGNDDAGVLMSRFQLMNTMVHGFCMLFLAVWTIVNIASDF